METWQSQRRVSRFDRLYQDAAQSRAKLAKKKKEMDSEVFNFQAKDNVTRKSLPKPRWQAL